MSETRKQTVLFLCTGNYYRSRFAEHYFEAQARAAIVPWRADSRGLAVGQAGNFGPISGYTVQTLRQLGIFLETHRAPMQLVEDDLRQAALIVALKEAEHRPLMAEQFPDWTDHVEYWHVHDLDVAPPETALAEIQERIQALVGRLRTPQVRGSAVQ